MKTKYSLYSTLVIVTLVSITSVFAQLPYKVYKNDLDMYSSWPQAQPIRESFSIGGFTLTVNLLHVGYTVYPKPIGNVLGLLHGDDYDATIRRIPPTKASLEELAVQMRSGKYAVVKTLPVHNSFGLEGVRATYGGKPSLFAQNIKVMRYFFVNKAGEVICFSAKATNTDPDWTYFEYLMTKRLAPLGIKAH